MNSSFDNKPLFASTSLPDLKLSLDYTHGVEFNLVVDTNIILNDIRYMAERRDKIPGLQTKLLELMISGVLKVHAPNFLKVEMAKHIPLFSERYKIPIEVLDLEWQSFEALIVFTEVPFNENEQDVTDPKDMPYVNLQKILKAPIISADSDITDMGGVVLELEALNLLQEYARQESKMLGIHFAGGLSLSISKELINSLTNLLKKFNNLHWGWLLLIAVAILAFYKKIRIFIKEELPLLYPFLENLYSLACEKIQGFSQLQQACDKNKIETRDIFQDLQNQVSNSIGINHSEEI